MDNLRPKVSIIGAGNVGVRFAYALMIRGIARQIVLVDLDYKKVQGEVMDLSHGAPYISPVEIIAGDYQDTESSDVVVITAGAKQKVGQTRLELINTNINIFKKIVPQLMKYTPQAIFLVVTNPVDVLSYAVYKLSGKPYSEVIGSGTVLDSARFRHLLALHCNIDPRNVHAYILGEHGDSEVPIWSKAMIGGVHLKDHCPRCKNHTQGCKQETLEKIFMEVRDSAYRIIECKGETSYGIGLALVRIVSAILKDENAVLPVSSLIQGYLGIEDIYMSLPAIINRCGVREILTLNLTQEEEMKLKASAGVIKSVIEKISL